MSDTKDTTDTTSSQQRTVAPTAEETELNRLRLEREKVLDPAITRTAQQGFDLSSILLTGGEGGGLPGFLQGLPGGIDEGVTQDIVDRSLGDVRAGLQGGGLLDSGVRSELEARTSADIRTQSATFNLQNLQQLLNLAVGGQAQPLTSSLGFGSQLSQSLAGLRGITQTGTSNTTSINSPSFFSQGGLGGQLIGAGGQAISGFCWVASEIFGGWYELKTRKARTFMVFKAPTWLRNFYVKYGKATANFIKDKPVLKALLRPLFEVFAWIGGR